MKFANAWADIAKQNQVLRIAILTVSATIIVTYLVLVKLAMKKPLIIERGCFSKIIKAANNTAPTETEIDGFIKQAIAERFDTDASGSTDWIAVDQLADRTTEQQELKNQGISQRVIVDGIKKAGDAYIVDTDRLLSVGKVRSDLDFPLVVRLAQTERSVGDPAGLVLVQVSSQKAKTGGSN